MTSKIGFIGLGAMGKPMAANIARAGFELTVYDLREERAKSSLRSVPELSHHPGKLRKKSDIIEIAVVDDAQAERVVTGEHGVIHGARAGSIVAIHSTILPARCEKLLSGVVPMESK
jgi:3-hydroxyisobutyrate dehydrogenase and related beta-hydroxyacid dehydrogenases